MLNKKALPKIINRPIIIMIQKEYEDTIYILDPHKKKFHFVYTEEDGVYTSEDALTEEALAKFRTNTMAWHWLASKKIKSGSGKILHWEYL